MNFNKVNRASRALVHARLKANAAILPLAIGMIALSSPAHAQNECGAAPAGGGTVTCRSTSNPYSGGITYPPQANDLNVVLDNGVAISTTTGNTPGVFVNGIGTNAIAVSGSGATVSTSGANANGVELNSIGGPVSVLIGNVTTSGSLSGGVRAIGGLDGNVVVKTGNVTTTGLDGSSFFFLPSSTAIMATGSGTGNVAVTSGAVSTAGQGARGVNASAGAGDVIVTTGSVTTSGGNAIAVAANSDTGNVTVNTSGAIATSGDGAQGIYATARNGAAAVRATSVATSGFNATGIEAISGEGGSSVAFDTVSTANTFATGVVAGSTGGNVSVTGGSVTAKGTSSSAIYGYSDTGAVNVTTTGNVASTGRGGFGIYAASTTGDTAVSANNVSTLSIDPADIATSRSAIYAQGANARVVVTGTAAMAGRAQYGGPADAITVVATNGNASADVNNVNSTGDTSRALSLTATGDTTATVRGAVSAAGAGTDAVVLDAGGKATVNLTAAGTITSRNGNLITANAVNGFTINNAGVLGVAANGYAIQVTGGPAIINNSGTLRGDILLTAGNDAVNNSGRFVLAESPNFGAGTDAFSNTGTVALVGGLTVPANVTMTGLEQFNSAGLVDLRNGVAGDRLTIPGAFTGSGNSQLGLDADLGTAASDRLVLGTGATGTTTILLRQTGTQTLFNPGTVLVQAGAASAAGAFTLGGADGGMNAGLIRYQIVYNPANFSYAVTGGPSDAAFRTLNYAEGIRSLWLKSADVVSAQLQARRDQLWSEGEGEPTGKIWVQMHGSVENRGNVGDFAAFGTSRAVNTGYNQDYFGGQLGLDFGGGSGERGGFAFGVTGGYISSSMNFKGSADRIHFDVLNAGAYASFTSGNVFVNGLAQYDYYWADARSTDGGFSEKSNGNAYGGRVEAGLRFGNDSFFVEPAASLSYVKSNFDSFASQGVSVDFNDADGLRGRAGGRLGTQLDLFGSKASLYAGGNYVHEFKGRDEVTFSTGAQSLSYYNNRVGDYGEAKLGIEIGQAGGVSGFVEGSYIRSFSDDSARRSDIEGAGGRAGLRVRF